MPRHLQSLPISRRWPAVHPDRLQLYSFPTPNGVKVSIALEEMDIPYEAHTVSIRGDQHTEEFLSLNPNGKIPAIADPNGPDGQLITLWESGAILLYLAEKSGKFRPDTPQQRHATTQWLMFQMGGLGPMIGQYGYFTKFAGKEIDDPRPRTRFLNECRRLLQVLEQQLEKSAYITGDQYSIADMAIFPWLRGAEVVYGAAEAFQMEQFPKTQAYLDTCLARPAVQRGLQVPPRE